MWSVILTLLTFLLLNQLLQLSLLFRHLSLPVFSVLRTKGEERLISRKLHVLVLVRKETNSAAVPNSSPGMTEYCL